MKKNLLFLAGLMTVVAVGFVSCMSSNAVSKNELSQIVRKQIDDRHFTIEVTRMLPMNGRSSELTSLYSLTVNSDSIDSYLPYFGTAYSIPYGGGQGLTFKAPITDYTENFDSKGTADISIQTRSEDDNYHYRIQIFKNGSASILVTPVNRQAISFYGNLKMKEE